MKRSGFKKLSFEEALEKKKLQQKSKTIKPKTTKKVTKKVPLAKILKKRKEVLWELCKTIIRKRDGNICFICGAKPLEKSNWHTGHFIPSSVCGGYLRYDIRNLHSSCYHCNINLGGNGGYFNERLRKVYGEKFVQNLFKDKEYTIKLDIIYVNSIITLYEEISTWTPIQLFNFTQTWRKKR